MQIAAQLALALVALCAAFAQQPDSNLKFEVASVKPYVPGTPAGRSGGGPGTADPEHLRYGRIALKNLLAIAYGVETDRVQGPQWLASEAFTIDAKVPASATKEQMLVMLQNLLRDRFKMALHKETKNFPAYEVIVAKGGPKIKKSAGSGDPAEAAKNAGQPLTSSRDANGFPVMPPGSHYRGTFSGGVARVACRDISIADFVKSLAFDASSGLGGDMFSPPRIIDHTGLPGTFDFTLEFRQKIDSDSDSPDIFAALEKQLGLRLQKADPIPLDVLVIDRMDKTPTEN